MEQSDANRPVALLTGGSGALGRACAVRLAESGFDIVLLDGGVAETGAAVLQSQAAGATVACLDEALPQTDGVPRAVERAWAVFGRVDCLVNAASTAGLARGDILAVSRESFDLCMDRNVRLPFFLMQAVAERMVAARSRRTDGAFRSIITLTTSALDHVVPADLADYAISKAALSAACRHFAVRLAPEGIGCFEVRPGLIEKDGPHRAQDAYDRLMETGFVAARRWGRPDDVASAVAALARGEFGYSVGQIIAVDGGMGLKTF